MPPEPNAACFICLETPTLPVMMCACRGAFQWVCYECGLRWKAERCRCTFCSEPYRVRYCKLRDLHRFIRDFDPPVHVSPWEIVSNPVACAVDRAIVRLGRVIMLMVMLASIGLLFFAVRSIAVDAAEWLRTPAPEQLPAAASMHDLARVQRMLEETYRRMEAVEARLPNGPHVPQELGGMRIRYEYYQLEEDRVTMMLDSRVDPRADRPECPS